jgi:hypothetical protein
MQTSLRLSLEQVLLALASRRHFVSASAGHHEPTFLGGAPTIARGLVFSWGAPGSRFSATLYRLDADDRSGWWTSGADDWMSVTDPVAHLLATATSSEDADQSCARD